MKRIIGLDIGGANLKAYHMDGGCRLVPFPLWKQPKLLPAALGGLLDWLPACDVLAVTMTGELCDCFRSKREGVNAILDAVPAIAREREIRVWSVDGFVDLETARRQFLRVASANWHALATQTAREFCPTEAGLLIDIGSTTTDIIPLLEGKPIPRGATDPERLQYGELVYTGVRRTPLCALLGLDAAAELFATTLDANLVLGSIAEDETDCDTADGRPATCNAAHARLARMLCADADLFTMEDEKKLAERAIARQVQRLSEALTGVVRAMHRPPQMFVLCGSGEFLAKRLLSPLPGTPGRMGKIISLSQAWGVEQSAAACAVAVAMLAAVE